jgi:transposase-like protein
VRGDPDAAPFPNSRNGTFPKTVASEIGDVELAVPRDRQGTFTPMLVPKGARRLDGLDAMIVSLYAGGMTVRDIGHHLVSTIGTELSHETISKVVDAVAEEVLAWQQRPLEALYPVIYLDAIVVKVRDGGHVRNKAAHIALSGSTSRASSTCWGSGCKPAKAPSSGRRCAPSSPTEGCVTC